MWLQNLARLAAILTLLLAASNAKGSDEKRSGTVKIKCVGDEETTLSLAVVEKSLNQLEELVSAMCAGHAAPGMPSLWEASWDGKPEFGSISNFKVASDMDEIDELGINLDDFTQIDSNDITDDVTKIEDDKPEAKNQEQPEVVEVKTFLGKLKGYKNKLEDNKGFVYSFLGVPYAQAPKGSRRFKPPLPLVAFGEREAFGFRSECPQIKAYGDRAFKFIGDEDCLFVNIFSPSLTKNPSALKPVMVWFHGGAFTMGAGNEYVPVEMVMKDVVVVTVNYRLSGLGFLTFGNDIVSGNMGLRDQLEALKWVKRFINNFGGDPNRVTIFGQSSGAMMVHALHLSPKASGLFKHAITQSGSMLMRRVKPEISDEKRTARNLAEKAGCVGDYSEEMLECMQKIPVEQFIKMSAYSAPNTAAEQKDRERGPWFPVVDAYSTDPILPTDPLEALKTGAFNKVPLMTGTIANDGALQVMSVLGPAPEKEKTWHAIASQFLMLSPSSNISETKYEDVIMSSIATKYYTNEDYDMNENGQSWMDLFTDSLFLSPDQKTAELVHMQKVPVYNYYMNYKPNTTISKLFGAPDNSLAPINGEDILHLFDQFEGVHLETEPETAIGDMMIEYWTNFAKYGNPNPYMEGKLPKWDQYSDKKAYLEIKEKPEMQYNIHPERMTFWQRLLWDRKEEEIDRLMLFGKLSKLFLSVNTM